MEFAFLNLAHDHARAASVATQASETTTAITEHALAAGEFAKAADATENTEAYRTLRLLEHHHQKLSELLRAPASAAGASTAPVASEVQVQSEKPLATSAAVAELRSNRADLGSKTVHARTAVSNTRTPRRLPPRDQSSSIISSLATARNIRAKHERQPLSPSISALQADGEIKARRTPSTSRHTSRTNEQAPGLLPPTAQEGRLRQHSSQSKPNELAKPDSHVGTGYQESFAGFYNAFETILHKISAPLAFAGLPLSSGDSDTQTQDSASRKKSQTVVDHFGAEPNLQKYISKAALRAAGRHGTSGTDSFYVVPSTGGTMSYARMASFADKEQRRLADNADAEPSDAFLDNNTEDDFVDARETQHLKSPSISRSSTTLKVNSKQLERRVEELVIENNGLKSNIDKLSKRLSLFEMSSQKSGSMLQESVRLMRRASPQRQHTVDDTSENRSDTAALHRRVAELEAESLRAAKEFEQLEKENVKLKSVVSRYRERWEKLLEGAKTRSKATGKEAPAREAAKSTGSSRTGESTPERYLAG